ncbi:transposase family protein [Streptomyces sp. NPDC046727]|uniref:transposase family protein n=1 Tax=Streptomyces sp. NPDC046727 TaxID=3155373 RepID=UPI0033E0BF0A
MTDGTQIRVLRPAADRKDRAKFISGRTKQNAVKSMDLTDAEGRVLYCGPVRPGGCADITHARQLGLVKLLADGPFMAILGRAPIAFTTESVRFQFTTATKPTVLSERTASLLAAQAALMAAAPLPRAGARCPPVRVRPTALPFRCFRPDP